MARVARADVPKAEEAEDNRFSGANRGGQGGGQRPGQRRSGGSSDAVFTPELTKTSKDSKRERDRENKNKKKRIRERYPGRTQTKSGRTQTEFQNPESTSETESTAEAGREETGDQGDHHSGEAYYP